MHGDTLLSRTGPRACHMPPVNLDNVRLKRVAAFRTGICLGTCGIVLMPAALCGVTLSLSCGRNGFPLSYLNRQVAESL